MTKPTARERIERAFHVSFKTPEQAAELLDAYRDQILTEAAELIRRSRGALNGAEWPDHCAALLLATRTNQES